MDYNKQIKEIEKHFLKNSKTVDNFKIGVEFEHFVVYKDTLKTVSYYGENGVAETLHDLEKLGYEGSYEGEYILGLEKGNKVITLEPGSQFELSIKAQKHIKDIEREYLDFFKDLTPILERKNQQIMAVGYHPETKIEEIKLLPKKRYDFMFNYFKTAGSMAHNMMKGTSALQVSLDYGSEEDYLKKFRVANALSPVVYAMFDNGLYFQGEQYDKHNIRALIWENCDIDRSGVVPNSLKDDFSFKKYAEYVLNVPPILIAKDGDVESTGKLLVKDVLDVENYSTEELDHLLTMVFPDVRTKRYIEIRMMDSVPYPLNMSAIALWTGIFYNEKVLDKAYEYIKDITIEDVNAAKHEMMDKGLLAKLGDKTLLEIGRHIVSLAKEGLAEEDIKYIIPLEGMLDAGKNPYEITKDRLYMGKKDALQWTVLKDIEELE